MKKSVQIYTSELESLSLDQSDSQISANLIRHGHQQCKVASALAVLGGKWKLPIIKQLTEGTKRYNELFHELDGITQRMLTKQLRELEDHNVITRKVYPVVPPKVEYSLTQAGHDLQNVIGELEKWGGDHLRHS